MHDGQIDFSSVDKGALAEKLRGALPGEMPTLASVHASSARKAVTAITDDFAFLIQNNPSGSDADEMLKVAQWRRELSEALERADVDGLSIDPSYREKYEEIKDVLEANWKQRHSTIPSAKWMLRADAIEHETDPLVCLDSYQALRQDMSYLEDAIGVGSERA